jgi:YVTN family beta-propeller protein
MKRSARFVLASCVLLLFGLNLPGHADWVTDTIATIGTVNPLHTVVAVNPVTDKIYVTNEIWNCVTVIDGATNTTATVRMAGEPRAIAVNPMTTKSMWRTIMASTAMSP